MVFEGDTNDSEGHFRWYDAIEQWGIPSGEYLSLTGVSFFGLFISKAQIQYFYNLSFCLSI